MLNKKFYKYFGIRVWLMELGMSTYYKWDKKKEHLIPAKYWQVMYMWMGFYIGGVGLVGIHLLQMYIKSGIKDIDEEGQTEPPPTDLKAFATSMIAGGEILLVTCLAFLNLVFLQRKEIFMFLFNELLDYNKKLSQMIEDGKLVLTEDQKFLIRATQWLIIYTTTTCTFLPFGVFMAVMTKIEPTHQLITEWFEIELTYDVKLLHIYIPLLVGVYGVGSTVNMMAMLISLYFMTATITTAAFTPEQMEWTPRIGPNRCNLVTAGFGKLSDVEVIHMYRIQQILNVLLNTFFKSVLVSFHHVGCLATFVVLIVFMARYDAVLADYGIQAYLVVFLCMVVPIILIFSQAKMAGAVVDVSQEFKNAGDSYIPRRFLFRKFCKSCTTFYIQVAYPFYNIHKETFTMWMQQAQDYSMELLLS